MNLSLLALAAALTLTTTTASAATPDDDGDSLRSEARQDQAAAKKSQQAKKRSGGQGQTSQQGAQKAPAKATPTNRQPSSTPANNNPSSSAPAHSAPDAGRTTAPPPSAEPASRSADLKATPATAQPATRSLPSPATSVVRPATSVGRAPTSATARVPARPQVANMPRPVSKSPAAGADIHPVSGRAGDAIHDHRQHARTYHETRAQMERTRQRVETRRAIAASHARHAHHAASHRAWVAHHSHHGWWYRHHGPYYHPWYRPVWSYGVFVYGPPPGPRVVIVNGEAQPAAESVEPKRAVDRTRTFAVGARGGSYLGAYDGGDSYGDFGMGIAARYRAAEALGFEVAWQYHDQTWSAGSERITQPLSASVELFALPWTRFSPYVLGGVTLTSRNWADDIHNPLGPVEVKDSLFGPHGGVGLEFAVGQKMSVNMEGRMVGYLNVPENDPTKPWGLQGNLGFNFYF